jgi:hypothetical protein
MVCKHAPYLGISFGIKHPTIAINTRAKQVLKFKKKERLNNTSPGLGLYVQKLILHVSIFLIFSY